MVMNPYRVQFRHPVMGFAFQWCGAVQQRPVPSRGPGASWCSSSTFYCSWTILTSTQLLPAVHLCAKCLCWLHPGGSVHLTTFISLSGRAVRQMSSSNASLLKTIHVARTHNSRLLEEEDIKATIVVQVRHAHPFLTSHTILYHVHTPVRKVWPKTNLLFLSRNYVKASRFHDGVWNNLERI